MRRPRQLELHHHLQWMLSHIDSLSVGARRARHAGQSIRRHERVVALLTATDPGDVPDEDVDRVATTIQAQQRLDRAMRTHEERSGKL